VKNYFLFACFALACRTVLGILPLPIPTEANEVDSQPGIVATDSKAPLPGYVELFSKSQLREMELPTFGNQKEALGYGAKTFEVPPRLRARVDFWKEIYTVHPSTEALMHDSKNLSIQYGVVDLTAIAPNPTQASADQWRALQRFLKQQKQTVERQLAFLHERQSNPLDIPVDLFKIFKSFEPIYGPEKFLKARQNIRAQIGQRDKIVQGFLFGGRYFPKLMEIFEQKGVPKELTRLTLVESAFNLNARSKVGASGVWQFMRETAKRFMRVDDAIDERNDPITAAHAAAELLRQNYEALQSWPLAVTAYNHGKDGMLRAKEAVQSADIADIVEKYDSPTFGFASANFYSEFLAILEIEREYRQHFGKILVDPPLEFEYITVDKEIRFDEFADACRLPEEQLVVFNLALTDAVLKGDISVPVGYNFRVPTTALEKCKSGYRNVSPVSLSAQNAQSM
jgi:membrane-bound lytic murein transglycosylase D